uniref:Uncharacterized protein n=1 Tax=viral metagenome TaxID=1070528 RepID=A0A6C0J430_9ZZZZ
MTRKNATKINLRKTRSKKQGGAKMPYVGPYYENPNAKLWDGVYKHNSKKVEEAFKEGADVNMKNDDGSWFLLVASGNGNARIVNLLLEKGIDVNITDDYNNTALSTAVRNAEYDVVELLLEKGADINKKNDDGDTPLIHAINFEDYDMVELLLEHPDIEYDINTQILAEELTPEDEDQNGIPYLIEYYLHEKNEIKENKINTIKELSNYKRRNIPSLSTLAYHQTPSAVDTYINLNPGTINRPCGKLGGKRRTRKSKRPYGRLGGKRRTRNSKRPKKTNITRSKK